MDEASRFASFGDFWPYYIGEHRHPLCRVMHFVGTGGFILMLLFSFVQAPARMGFCLAGGLLVAFLARQIESKRRAGIEALCIVLLWAIGSPWIFSEFVPYAQRRPYLRRRRDRRRARFGDGDDEQSENSDHLGLFFG